MVTTPIAPRGSRRWLLEQLIWLVDLVSWAGIIGVGYGILADPPISVQISAEHQPAIPYVLAGFFLAGGIWGLAVRTLRLGLFEAPAIWLAGGGLVLFAANGLWATVLAAYPSTVLVSFSVSLTAMLTRRVLELQIFTEAKPAPPGAAA